jgi:hypothetical protein
MLDASDPGPLFAAAESAYDEERWDDYAAMARLLLPDDPDVAACELDLLVKLGEAMWRGGGGQNTADPAPTLLAAVVERLAAATLAWATEAGEIPARSERARAAAQREQALLEHDRSTDDPDLLSDETSRGLAIAGLRADAAGGRAELGRAYAAAEAIERLRLQLRLGPALPFERREALEHARDEALNWLDVHHGHGPDRDRDTVAALARAAAADLLLDERHPRRHDTLADRVEDMTGTTDHTGLPPLIGGWLRWRRWPGSHRIDG